LRLTGLSFLLALAATVFWLFAPAYSSGSGVASKTLIEVNGFWVLALLAFPPAVALLPLIWRKRWVRVAAAVVLVAFAFVGGFSVGLPYFPAGIAMILASVFDTARTPSN